MTAYAIFLRAVNVGGRAPLPMATYRAVLEDLGYADVRTYLQSGNAVARTSVGRARVASDVHEALARASGLDVDVIVRTATDMARVIERAPFDEDAPPTAKHVAFFARAEDAARLRRLEGGEFGADRLVLDGENVYLSSPNGLGRSKLAAAAARDVAAGRGTMRNWNTVVALSDLLGGP